MYSLWPCSPSWVLGQTCTHQATHNSLEDRSRTIITVCTLWFPSLCYRAQPDEDFAPSPDSVASESFSCCDEDSWLDGDNDEATLTREPQAPTPFPDAETNKKIKRHFTMENKIVRKIWLTHKGKATGTAFLSFDLF